MKRDMDLVRLLLLRIEQEGSPALRNVPEVEGFDEATVAHHISLMLQAGLVTAIDASSFDGLAYLEIKMTWHGHEFLETIRDPEIWQSTKAGAAKVGSWSIGIIAELAKAAVVAKAQSLGFPIGG